MKTAFRIALSALLAVSLAGCDILYGVQRTAELDAKPPLDCVAQVVRTAPGVTEMRYSAEHTGTGLFHPTPWVYTYLFDDGEHGDIRGSVQLYEEYDGAVSFDDSLLTLREPPPQKWIDATRPVMRSIELSLAERCGAAALPSRIKEVCMGVICAPLDEIRSQTQ